MEQFNKLLDQYKLPIALSLIGLVLIVAGNMTAPKPSTASHSTKKSPAVDRSSLPEAATVTLDIAGAVQSPGVYSIASGSRMVDIVKEAGGFLNTANADYISKYINLSQKLTDGEKIYIPFAGDNTSSATIGDSANLTVSINNGTIDELISLPGVGQVTAQKIIDNRPYSDTQDLLNNKIVNKGVFEKIKNLITL